MLNDRDDKYEGQEESEYHFSDEEVNYEVETESPKPIIATESKENIFSRLTQSKRMVISIVVFLVLVFVVYKMVTPSTVAPSTTITPVTTVQQTRPQPVAPQPVMPVAQVQTPAPMSQPAVPVAPAVQAVQQPPVPVMPAAQPTPVTTTTTVTTAPAPQPMPQQPLAQQPMAMQQPMQQPPQQAMPAVIPVQSTPALSGAPTQLPPTLAQQIPGGMEAQLAQVSATSNQLANQAQAEYAQKLNDYEAQNKMLQDQLQALNTRIAGMESQMNQLIQALTQPPAPPTPPTIAAPTPPMPPLVPALPQTDGSRIGYNVQAIIPGRAWLRSESGETLTVAEGDLIKGIGRVTKIDPYDGVVEINTGTKVITLSYGTGG